MIVRPLAAAIAVGMIPCAASAQDSFEFSFGGRIASDYISDGESLSDGRPVLQGYAEVERGLLFGGIWGSTIDDGENEFELELSLGIRPQLGDLDISLSYARTFYDDSGDCCGEVILFVEQPLSDRISAGTGISYDPGSDEFWLEVLNEYAFDEVWSISGGVSTDFGTDDEEDGNVVTWDLGVTRAFSETFYGDLRYHDSNIGSAKLVVALGFDF